MGGRGSGGSRGGGGGSANTSLKNLLNTYENDNDTFRQKFMDKYHAMSDEELNKAYRTTQNQMNRARRKYDSELEKFNSIRKTFAETPENDKNFPKISAEFDNQIAIVQNARLHSNMRSQIHYIALNEKRNIRKQ
ncbi:unknown [Brachyspira sp. CAG:484]|mgnify:CR=1 FL=1|nr:unknown [Brachyspira sp. CAG:484]